MSFTKVAPAGIGTEPGTSILIGDSLLHSTGIDIGSNTGIGVTIRKHGDATFTGIVTAASFSGSGANLTGIDATAIKHTDGNVKVQAINTGANLTGNLSVSGNLGVAGVLTYEDVTNVDSIGIITARSTVSIADSIIHTGDTNTSLRFPSADTIAAETGGLERLRIDSSGRLLLGTTTAGFSTADDLTIATSGSTGITIRTGTTNQGNIYFADGTTGATQYAGLISYNHNTNHMFFGTSDGTERLRITSEGKILGGNHLNDRGAVLQIESSDHAMIGIHRNTADHGAPAMNFSASRGTSAGSNTIVQSGDYLGLIRFSGTDGSDLASGAQITGIVDGTPGSNDMPTRLGFWTSADGTQSPTERLRISSAGHVTKPSHPAFFARPPATYSLGQNVDAHIGGTWSTSDSEAFARGTLTNGTSVWNNTDGIFTVPVTGIYYFHLNLFMRNNTTRRDAFIYRNGTSDIIARTEIGDPGEGSNNKSVAVSAVVLLSVNDTIRFGGRTVGGTELYITVKPWSYACGYLIA